VTEYYVIHPYILVHNLQNGLLGKKKKFLVSTSWRRIAEADVQLHPFLTSALNGGEWLISWPRRCTLGLKKWYPQNRGLGGARGRSKRFGENKNVLPPTGSSSLYPRRYTDWAINPKLLTHQPKFWLVPYTLLKLYLSSWNSKLTILNFLYMPPRLKSTC
jgi:hypothetical protein